MLPQDPRRSPAGGGWGQAGHGGAPTPAGFLQGVRVGGQVHLAAEGTPPHGTCEDQGRAAHGRTPSRPRSCPGAGGAAAASRGGSGTAPLQLLLPPRLGPRGRTTLPGRGSVSPRLPRGAAAARHRDRPPPGRRAAHRAEQKARPRPGNVPGRRAEPRRQPRGPNPQPGGPARPGTGPAAAGAPQPAPHRRVGPCGGHGGEGGNRGRRTQCNSSGGAEGGRGQHNEASGSPCPFR